MGTAISYTTKKQRKYQTLLVKIALYSFTLASFDQSLWIYTLGSTLVYWFSVL
jgi:hypothetical protein